ncbi:MAG: hypothetical protein KAY24_01615, partial [Candidatus Eisenbacteria sp.]|nr:hypothetical protein [Candidatus Eisenbacteria bacterium]
MYRKTILPAVFLALSLALLALPAWATTYTSTCAGALSGTYDADPNGVYPDETGYGDFTAVESDYVATLEFPLPEEGYFDWYLDPVLYITGTLIGQIPVLGSIDADGILVQLGGQPVIDASWEELGYEYIPGLGLFLTNMITPESFFPADPDRILGLYEYDHEPDGQVDVALEITGAGGVHHLVGNIFRSATWMGIQGTGLPEAFADYLDSVLPGLPPELLDQIRAIDLTPFIDFELLIGYYGGPIAGNDLEGSGTFELTVRAVREPTD